MRKEGKKGGMDESLRCDWDVGRSMASMIMMQIVQHCRAQVHVKQKTKENDEEKYDGLDNCASYPLIQNQAVETKRPR